MRVLALSLLAGCITTSPPALDTTPFRWDDDARAAVIEMGKAVLDRHQCNRCHVIDDLGDAERPLHCTSCHQFLDGLDPAGETYGKLVTKYGTELIERYRRNIVHLEHVPDLTAIGKRVRPDWIGRYLQEPFDVRPVMAESMIRHNLSADEIEALVRYFAAVADEADPYDLKYVPPPPPPEPDAARLQAGAVKFREAGCAVCHSFGNVDTGVKHVVDPETAPAVLRAPNLRFARERMRPDRAVAWIRDPASIQPDTLMPAFGLSEADATLVRDWLWYADPELASLPPEPSPDVVLLDRPVPYAEVKDQVLGWVCVHCHMNDYEKDPGPGNLGGLGFAGIGLSMRTYESLVQGAVDASGARYSVLEAKEPGARAPIVESLVRRRLEGLRDQVAPGADHAHPPFPAVRGMPLGLSTLDDHRIAVLATWIAQDCPGPTEVTGIAGVWDGFPVPDGPIAVNTGCQQRDPSPVRPAWAVDSRVVGEVPEG